MGARAPLHVAIVGAGLMGHWHARYAAASGARVAAIVDPDARAREALKARHAQAEGYADLEQCLAAQGVAVVHVCTPLSSHEPLARLALERRKHVLVEKPLTPSAAQTRALVELAREQGILLSPVHQFPFQRGMRLLRERLDRVGDLVELAFTTSSAGGSGRDAADRRALLFEILPHPLSLFRAVLRRPVRGVDWRVVASTDDDLDVGGTCDGVLLRARISLRGRPTRNELTVVGERGTAHVDLFHGFSVVESRAPSRRSKLVQPFARGQKLVAAAAANLAVRAVRSEPAYPGLRELIAAFYLGVRSNGRAPIADDEAVEVAEIVDRLRASPAA